MLFRLADAGTRRFRRLYAGPGLLLLVIIVLPVFAASVWWLSGPTMAARSTGTSALWLSHAWAGSAHTEAKYARLAELLRRNQISDAYFHVGPIDGDGAIPPARYMHAPELVAALHRLAPGVHIQAYAGQVLVGAGGPLALRSAAVRDRILGTARALLDLGFDGIHYDIEPLTPTDDDFLDLLERTHAMTGERGAILSASIPRLGPVQTSEHAPAWPGPFTTGTYLRQVATRVDQVAVMVYGLPVPTAPLIGWVYAWETAQVLDLIGDQVTVFTGVPTYEEGPHLTGEDLRTAIRGTRRGIDQLHREPNKPHGLAIFAEWTTSDHEWAVWQQEWLAPHS